jgi:hypothetical protein
MTTVTVTSVAGSCQVGIFARDKRASAGSRGWLSNVICNGYGVIFDPHEMCTAVEAQGIQVHDATDAPEWQSLLMPMAADILAAMRQQAAVATYRRA